MTKHLNKIHVSPPSVRAHTVCPCLPGGLLSILGFPPTQRFCFHQSSMGICKGMSSFLPKPRLIPVPRIFFPGHVICPASCSGSAHSITLKSEPPQGSLCGLACTASILMIIYGFLLLSIVSSFLPELLVPPERGPCLHCGTLHFQSLSGVWCLEDFQ